MPNLNDYLSAERIKFKTPNGKANTRGNQLKKQWTTYCIGYIRKSVKGLKIQKPVKLYYKFYEPNMKRDLDNIASFAMKIIQDSLVISGVLPNDGWAWIKGFDCDFDVSKDNPRIEITIEEVE
jgi:Holliday junction resolvase RusA-like endonuclease